MSGEELLLQRRDNDYAVYHAKRHIGTIQLYDNPCHMKNSYVKLKMESLDTNISGELFGKLRELAGRPLQAMASADDGALTAFLLAGGFQCRRKCYETEAGREDYIGGQTDVELAHSRAGEPNYERACRMMFDRYTATHMAVNPWTAGYEAFCAEMPVDVIYAGADGGIESLAFIEDNEIAYVCGTDKGHFERFARSLVEVMLERHERICFESDDGDWAAMLLRAMFKNQDEASFDTYVYDNASDTE